MVATAAFITVANKKLKVTADTAVLFVDSAADEDNQIGVNYTYGTTAMAKAEEYATNKYSYNVMFMVDETKADDVNLKVLVVDTTGAFKGQKYNDPTTPSSSAKTYVINDTASVKVADSAIVTDAVATFNTDKTMTVQLFVDKAYTHKDADKITVTVNGVDKDATIGTLKDGKVQITVPCNEGDKVVVNVDKDAFTKA